MIDYFPTSISKIKLLSHILFTSASVSQKLMHGKSCIDMKSYEKEKKGHKIINDKSRMD